MLLLLVCRQRRRERLVWTLDSGNKGGLDKKREDDKKLEQQLQQERERTEAMEEEEMGKSAPAIAIDDRKDVTEAQGMDRFPLSLRLKEMETERRIARQEE